MSALQLRQRIEPGLLRTPGLDDRLRIYVEGTPDTFPRHIEGVRVEVVKTGKIRALHLMNVPWFTPQTATSLNRTQRFRPCPGGVSVGHPKITAGTLGTPLPIRGTKYGRSNNHIFAATSTDLNPRARIGDPIFQPGVYDLGTEEDTIGSLAWYQPMYEQGMNLIDAALMLPADPSLLSDDILDIGPHTGLATANLEEVVQKSGRTTNVTQARILDVDATLKVGYGEFTLTFTNQIITDYMASGGDSGSALLNMDRKLVGLLFAGSNYVTVHNHIGNVISAIGGVPPTPGAGAPFTIVSALPTLIGMAMSGIF
jgi:hypothetical protein